MCAPRDLPKTATHGPAEAPRTPRGSFNETRTRGEYKDRNPMISRENADPLVPSHKRPKPRARQRWKVGRPCKGPTDFALPHHFARHLEDRIADVFGIHQDTLQRRSRGIPPSQLQLPNNSTRIFSSGVERILHHHGVTGSEGPRRQEENLARPGD